MIKRYCLILAAVIMAACFLVCTGTKTARAVTTHKWLAVPVTCEPSHAYPQSAYNGNGGGLDMNSWVLVRCRINLPQGAVITSARAFGWSATYGTQELSMDVYSVSNSNPLSATSIIPTWYSESYPAGWKWWNSGTVNVTVDNEVNSYWIQAKNNYYVYGSYSYRTISMFEVTYTTNP